MYVTVKEIVSKLGGCVSITTIRNRLRDSGIKRYVRKTATGFAAGKTDTKVWKKEDVEKVFNITF
jgi:hypothetical protein